MIRPTTTTIVALVLCVTLVGLAPGGAVAQDDSIWDGFGANNDEDVSLSERISIANEEIMALIDRASYQAATLTTEETDAERAERYASAFATEFAAHNETLETYVNQRFSGNASEYGTLKLTFSVGEATATRYVAADVNNSTGNFTNVRVLNSTDRAVDLEIGLSGYAAKNAAAELEYFATEYAAKNRDIDRQLLVRMANRYSGDITLPEEAEYQ